MAHDNPILICGAGIAGISAAYHLAVQQRVRSVMLVDERPPLSLTSDKSTEAYRNFWPGPDGAMVQMMNRSIDLLEQVASQTGNRIRMNRRGYLFATGDPRRVADWHRAAENAARAGAGEVRFHAGGGDAGPGPVASPPVGTATYVPHSPHEFRGQPDGVDIITDKALIRRHFPYLTEKTLGVMHVRRAGWLSAQQLGAYLLERAREAGVQLVSDQVVGVEVKAGRVESVRLRNGGKVRVAHFVNAAGPLLAEVGRMLGVEIPVFNELHLKVSFNDTLGVIPREAPMVIWADPITVQWKDEERAFLLESPETHWMTRPLQPSAHFRPDGEGESDVLLMLWEYHTPKVEPVFPIRPDPVYSEMVLRGMAEMVPGLRAYLERLPKPYVDGGYYTKTRENRPLACPLPVEGASLLGAFGGFGIMAAMGMGELLAAHVVGAPLPAYAPAFDLRRYEDEGYRKKLADWGESWQL